MSTFGSERRRSDLLRNAYMALTFRSTHGWLSPLTAPTVPICKVGKGVDLTRSPFRWRPAAICAKGTAGVGVRAKTWSSCARRRRLGPQHCHALQSHAGKRGMRQFHCRSYAASGLLLGQTDRLLLGAPHVFEAGRRDQGEIFLSEARPRRSRHRSRRHADAFGQLSRGHDIRNAKPASDALKAEAKL